MRSKIIPATKRTVEEKVTIVREYCDQRGLQFAYLPANKLHKEQCVIFRAASGRPNVVVVSGTLNRCYRWAATEHRDKLDRELGHAVTVLKKHWEAA